MRFIFERVSRTSTEHGTRGRRALQWCLLCCVLILTMAPAHQALAAKKFKSFELKTPDGTTRTLDDYLDKATLIAFFFPTCTYCNQSLPATMKIYDKYRDQGLSMVWINIVEEEEDMIPEWLAQHEYDVPVLVGASQRYLAGRYGLRMSPEHYILNNEGRILFKQRGFKAGYEEELEQNVKEALNLTP